MYKVEVDYAPAYEFITSMYFYINKDRLKIYELGTDWKKNVDKTLAPSIREILLDKRMEVLHRISLLIPNCPGKRTPEEFIQWFKSLPTTEIYDCMFPWVKKIPMDMGTLQKHFVYLFTEWNEQYFKHIDPSILESLEEDAHQKMELLGKMDGLDLVEMSTNGIRIKSKKARKLILIPQYHYSPASVIDHYHDRIACLYPVELNEDSPFIKKKATHFFSSLSDQNRLFILKSLYEKERTFTELLTLTNLTKSNLHYHLAMLRTSGLIRAHYSGERVEYYSLRLSTFSNMYEDVHSYIRSGSI